MSVTVTSWQALHSSGTKFYHIITLVDAMGNSAAVHHWGPAKIFTKPELTGMGQNHYEGFKNAGSAQAGLDKRIEKERNGYHGVIGTTAKETVIGKYDTQEDLTAFCMKAFSKDAASIKNDLHLFVFDRSSSTGDSLLKELQVEPVSPTHTADMMKDNADWGTW